MRARLAFLGSADFAVPSLRALAAAGRVPALVVSQPDRPKGRGHQVQAPPLKRAALELGLEVWQPERLRDGEAGDRFRAAGVDLACVVAYGQLLPPEVLEAPRLGCVNVHASLLPRWRGAAPIEWALASGDAETGVCAQRMVRRLDAGDLLLSERRALGPEDEAPALHAELAGTGARLLLRAVEGLEAGTLRASPQDEALATHAPLLRREHGFVEFARSRAEVLNRFRAFKERPGVRVFLGPGEPARVLALADGGPAGFGAPSGLGPGRILELAPQGLRVACLDGSVWLERLVPPSGRPMGGADCARGLGLGPGSVLPVPPVPEPRP